MSDIPRGFRYDPSRREPTLEGLEFGEKRDIDPCSICGDERYQVVRQHHADKPGLISSKTGDLYFETCHKTPGACIGVLFQRITTLEEKVSKLERRH